MLRRNIFEIQDKSSKNKYGLRMNLTIYPQVELRAARLMSVFVRIKFWPLLEVDLGMISICYLGGLHFHVLRIGVRCLWNEPRLTVEISRICTKGRTFQQSSELVVKRKNWTTPKMNEPTRNTTTTSLRKHFIFKSSRERAEIQS